MNEFVERLRRQRDKYREMSAVVERQQAVLSGSDLDALVALVERKRVLMAEIEELERALRPDRERWAEIRKGLDASARREAEATIAETKAILAALVKLEDEGRALLEERQASAAERIQAVLRRRKAGRAYGAGAAGADPGFRGTV